VKLIVFGSTPVTRRTYAASGFGLMALKYAVEALVVHQVTGRWFSPLDYLNPLLTARQTALGGNDWLLAAMAAWTLPFLWIGVSMTWRRLEDAARCFRNSLEINNKFFRSRVYVSMISQQMGDRETAVREALDAKQSCPNFYRENLDALVLALRAGSDDEIARLYSELIEERPSSAQISKELAVEAIQEGNTEEAIRELKKAIALKPDYPDLHNFLGIAYGNNGMVDDAVHEFEISLKINPYYLKARLNLALLYYENSRYDEAQAQLDLVLKVQPDNQLANNLLHELRLVAGGKPAK
jgi:tetratricopeptide (TPR) repeat protein